MPDRAWLLSLKEKERMTHNEEQQKIYLPSLKQAVTIHESELKKLSEIILGYGCVAQTPACKNTKK